MPRRRSLSLSAALIGLISLIGVSFAVRAQPDTLPVFTPADCPVAFPYYLDAACGTVTVPQDRAHPDERTLDLAVAIIPAQGTETAPDPLIFLDGGPGARTLDSFAGGLGTFLTRLNRQRAVILFDYRGIGYSQPALTCPEMLDVTDESWIPVCRDRFAAEGVDVTHFTTRDNAADAADIMRALMPVLNFETYNIWGGSYGSSVAMTLLRDQPDDIRAAIVTALQPPQGDLTVQTLRGVLDALDGVSDWCQADPECAADFPGDLTDMLLTVLERLNAEPYPVDANGVTGELDALDIMFVLSEMLKDETNIPRLPGMIAALYAGQYALAAPYANAAALPDDPQHPVGAWLSMRCTDSILATTTDALETGLADVNPLMRSAYAAAQAAQVEWCQTWGARIPTDADRAPAQSDVPTMIISGALDPYSSQDWLDSTLAGLPNGHGYLLPYYMHYVVHNLCVSNLLYNFVREPDAEPDTTCLTRVLTPDYR